MLSLTFLDTGAATPTIDRNVAGLAVHREGETLLFDCGEGSGKPVERDIKGGTVGVILDGRGRPLKLPDDPKACREAVTAWVRALDLYPK